jgi:hypothetical protein
MDAIVHVACARGSFQSDAGVTGLAAYRVGEWGRVAGSEAPSPARSMEADGRDGG